MWSKSIRFHMENLKLHDDIGYLWRENLFITDTPGWYDQEKYPLITDERGFLNAEEAIAKTKARQKVQIVGLGDSFMHDGAFVFREFFGRFGISYYNMAMHRHCPPQYNIILDRFAVNLKPDTVIYGIFENDFFETMDFENWRRSGLDWFTYHSGTWGGMPLAFLPRGERLLEIYLPGMDLLYKRLRRAMRTAPSEYRYPPSYLISEEEKTRKVFSYVARAAVEARAHGIGFLALLIPGKEVDSEGRTEEDANYDMLAGMLSGSDIPYLDLRPVFLQHPDRASLFYRIGGHWNRAGMTLAAVSILQHLPPALPGAGPRPETPPPTP